MLGGEGVDSLTGGIKKDLLVGNAGADTLIGGKDNDTLVGGKGEDTYKLFNGDGQDRITDDGGTLTRDGKPLAAGTQNGADKWYSNSGIIYQKQGDDLLIRFAGGDQLTIDDFDFTTAQAGGGASSYGISFTPAKLSIHSTLNRRLNLADTEETNTDITLAEGGLTPFTVFASSIGDADRTITLTANGDTSHITLSTGADLLAFEDGELTLTLPAGQDSLSFFLTTNGDVDANDSLSLAATLSDGEVEINSGSVNIELTSFTEPGQNTNAAVAGNGNAEFIDRTGTGLSWDQGGRVNQAAPDSSVRIDGNGGNDIISLGGDALDDNDQVFGGAGNDLITTTWANTALNTSDGTMQLHGGDGGDVISSGDNRGELHGDAGNDLLEANVARRITAAIAATPGELETALMPEGMTWLDFIAPHLQLRARTAATVDADAGTVATSGGSWQIDSNGDWRLDPSRAWLAGNQDGGGHPAGVSPALFADTTASGSFTDQYGEVTYTLSVTNDRVQVNYSGTYEQEGLPPQNRSMSASLTTELFGVRQDNAKPHTLDGGSGADTLIAGDGGDTLIGGAGNDLIQGGQGDDLAWGDLGPTSAAGSGQPEDQPGNDQIALGDGDDYADGGDGDDVILGEAGSDILFGGRGNDILIAGKLDANATAAGDDLLDGEDGDDTVLGGSGSDDLFGGAGNDWLQGERILDAAGGSDYLDGGAGDDTLLGGGGNDILIGGAGQDSLDGGLGDDEYVFNLNDSPGAETIVDAGGTDTIRFGTGIGLDGVALSGIPDTDGVLLRYGENDWLTLDNTIEKFAFADGANYTLGQLIALRGDASLAGHADTASEAYGTGGDDGMAVTAAQTTVTPGRGNDTVTIDGGGHTYVYASGDGTDHVGASGGGNTLRIEGATPGDIRLGLGSLAIRVGDNPDDVIHIEGFDPDNPTAASFDTFDFVTVDANQAPHVTRYTLAELLAQGFDIEGTDGDDTITGTAVQDRMAGGAGDDLLRGGASSDTYYFNWGDGNDTIDDLLGFNAAVFGEGLTSTGWTASQSFHDGGRYLDIAFEDGDTLSILSGELGKVASFQFADGTTMTTGDILASMPGVDFLGDDSNNTLQGYAGDDRLEGGLGDDTLQGGAGKDTYVFNSGDGADTIFQHDAAASDQDTIEFGAGIMPENIVMARGSDGRLTMTITGDDGVPSGDSITVAGSSGQSPRVVFADGAVWEASVLEEVRIPVEGTDAANTLNGGPYNDAISGLGGNDTLHGNDGSDLLDGGAGFDQMTGGAGDDVYLFGRGNSNDLVLAGAAAGGSDTVRFKAGIAPQDILLTQSSDRYRFTILDTSESLGVEKAVPLDRVEFSDGTVWNGDVLVAMLAAAPTGVFGSTDNDTLNGTSGNDALVGGAGNDILTGGAGSDVYVFGRGDGMDTIHQTGSLATDVDVIRFRPGIVPADVSVVRNSTGYVFTITDTGDSITAVQPTGAPINAVEFADGTVWDSEFLNNVPSIVGTEAGESLSGTVNRDVIAGLGGDDVISTGDGNDRLIGGLGNDILDGGAGKDTYVFNRGDGIDTIYDDSTGADAGVLVFGVGIAPQDISLGLGSLVLDLGGGDAIHIANFNPDDPFSTPAFESFNFSDGTSIGWDELLARGIAVEGTENGDNLAGTAVDDSIHGFAGSDFLYGFAGNDTLDGGSGFDYLSGGEGDDTYLFGRDSYYDNVDQTDAGANDNDVIVIGEGVTLNDVTVSREEGGYSLSINNADQSENDDDDAVMNVYSEAEIPIMPTVRFADGSTWTLADLAARDRVVVGTEDDDELDGGSGNDTISGLENNDELYGQDGDDVLDGGPGDDTLVAGRGNDTFLFGRGSGNDEIKQYNAGGGDSDVIALAADVAPADLALYRDEGQGVFLLRIEDTGDSVSVNPYTESEETVFPDIAFADGKEWGTDAWLNAAPAVIGGGGEDELYGSPEADLMFGFGDDDSLYGDEGADTLVGGAGNDELNGGLGDDVYVFNRGDGRDRITLFAGEGTESTGADTLRFGAGIAPGDITITMLVGEGDGGLLFAVAGDEEDAIEVYPTETTALNAQFADGTLWDEAEIFSRIALPQGTEEGDYLVGNASDNTLSGFGGDDEIEGRAGNDALIGGTGNDWLRGGDGNDTYVFNRGDGADVIDQEDSRGQLDTILFGADIVPADVTFSDGTEGFVLSVNGSDDTVPSGDSITIYGFPDELPQVAFADGTVWDAETLLATISNTTGTAADDLLIGTGGSDAIDGGDGNDRIYGLGGDDTLNGDNNGDALFGGSGDDTLVGGSDGDTLVGGAGNDTMSGSEGDDWYEIDAVSGQDTIVETADSEYPENGISFSNVAPESLQFTRYANGGNDLKITIAGAETSVTIQDWFNPDAPVRIAAFGFDDELWEAAQIHEAVWANNSAPAVAGDWSRTVITDKPFALNLKNGMLTDPDGDRLFYSAALADGSPLPDWLVLDAASGRFSGTPAAGNIGSLDILVTATDANEVAASNTLSLTIRSNAAAMVAAVNRVAGLGTSFAIAPLLNVSDPDGDVPTRYQFRNTAQGGGHLLLDGVAQPALSTITLTPDQLSGLEYAADTVQGNGKLKVRAYDGFAWGAWTSWDITSSDHATNTAAVVTSGDGVVGLGASVAASSLFGVSDADGDAVQKYQFIDTTEGGGYLVLDGVAQAADTTISLTADQLAGLQYVGGDIQGTEKLKARTWDGLAWGAWTAWDMISSDHAANAAPVVTASASRVGINAAVSAASLFGINDADGDAVQQYQFRDVTDGGGYLTLNGAAQAAATNITISADQLAGLQYAGGAAQGMEKLKARAWDGLAWGAWTMWDMVSSDHATNAAPVVTAANQPVLAGQTLALSSLFSVTDADGDAPLQYQIRDAYAGGSYLAVNGETLAAATTYTVSAADLGLIDYVGGAEGVTEAVKLRAHDGLAWGAWTTWKMTASGFEQGTGGDDVIVGDGDDILIGGAGNDTLTTPSGNGLLAGGEGNDTLTSAGDASFLAGGTGDDTLHTGSGDDVISFNAGDGQDTVHLNGGSDTLSLGGGVRYQDMSLSKNGNDLVLDTGNGSGDSITFKDWYADINKQSLLNLQVIADTLSEFNAQGGDPLYDNQVEMFDFRALVDRFDQVRTADANITSWNMMDDLLDAHLFGTDDGAIGGDLAYQYGHYGNFANVGLVGARNVLIGSQFALGVQAFQSLPGLQEGVVRLG